MKTIKEKLEAELAEVTQKYTSGKSQFPRLWCQSAH
jgi:hypothetical protein